MKVRVQFTVWYEVDVTLADVPADEIEEALNEIDFDQLSVSENQMSGSQVEIEDFEVIEFENEG
jgi:hypothetical protein